MKPPEILKTERLLLRPPAIEDAKLIFEQYAQDVEVTRYLVWKPHSSIEETQEFLLGCLSAWSDGDRFPWAILLKADNSLIGMVELRYEHGATFGYVLGKKFWGCGYMPEAVRSLIDWALQQKSIYRVWSICDVENFASARVLEKVGMQRECVLQRWSVHPNISNEPRDCYCYAKVK